MGPRALPEFGPRRGSGFGTLTSVNQIVRQQDGLNVEELALELLRPSFGIVEGRAEFVYVDRQTLLPGRIYVNKMARPHC